MQFRLEIDLLTFTEEILNGKLKASVFETFFQMDGNFHRTVKVRRRHMQIPQISFFLFY